MKYLLQFIIGSNVIIFLMYFIFVNKKINENELNFNYFHYSILMPLLYGIINVISKIFQEIFKLSDILRQLLACLITYILLVIILFKYNLYNYNLNEWKYHLIIVFIHYLFTFLVLINGIEKILTNKKFTQLEIYIMILLTLFTIINNIRNLKLT